MVPSPGILSIRKCSRYPGMVPNPRIISILGCSGYPRVVLDPGILSIQECLGYPRMVLNPGILSIQECSRYPTCVHVCHLIAEYLVSWDTWDIPGWSQICSCLSPYPGILSILGHSGYPEMVPNAYKSVPLSWDI